MRRKISGERSRNLNIGTKIQLAIGVNVLLAILVADLVVPHIMELTGTMGIVVNLLINSSIAFIYGLIVSRAITRPLSQASTALHEVAQIDGDLSYRLTVHSRDEVGLLSESFNTFLDKLQAIIAQVVNSSHQLTSATRRMSDVTSQTTAGVRNSKRKPKKSRLPWLTSPAAWNTSHAPPLAPRI